MTSSDWISIVGTVASLAGLVFSWFAWREAGRAKNAAREAVVWVRKRNLAQEVLRLSADAKEFLTLVQQNRIENAISVSNNLAHALSRIRSSGLSGSLETDKLKACIDLITEVTVRLNVDGMPIDPFKVHDLMADCHQIHQTVCDVAGYMELSSEGARL